MAAELCVICTEPLASSDSALPGCSHRFHRDCAIEWFRAGNASCPLCRCVTKSQRPRTTSERAAAMIAFSRNRAAPTRLRQLAQSHESWAQRLNVARGQLRLIRSTNRSVFAAERNLSGRVNCAQRRLRRLTTDLGLFTHTRVPVSMFQTHEADDSDNDDDSDDDSDDDDDDDDDGGILQAADVLLRRLRSMNRSA